MSKPYYPVTGTAAHSLCQFFYDHRDEELSLQDISTKYSVPVQAVPALIGEAVAAKLLALSVNGRIVSAGDNLLAAWPQRNTPAGKTATGRATAAAKPRMPKLDINSVVIRDNVPIPEAKTGVQANSPYRAPLDKMKPGSSVELSAQHAKSLVAHAKKLGVKVAVRTLQDGKAGVWRLPNQQPAA